MVKPLSLIELLIIPSQKYTNHLTKSRKEPLTFRNYSVRLNIGDEYKDRKYIELILEDVFGLNNPLLQTQENLVKSITLQEKRKKMVNEFKNIMFTSLNKKTKSDNYLRIFRKKSLLSENLNKKGISVSNLSERNGFIIVFDLTEPSTLEDVNQIIIRSIISSKNSQ